jgi:hypothetical protein
MRRNILLLVNTLMALLYASIGYAGFYDLFVHVPNIHIPRVEISYNTWQEPIVRFVLNTPTVAAAIIVLGAVVALCGTVYTFWVLVRGGSPSKGGWGVQAIGLGIALIAWIVQVNDLLSTAFQGVG